MKVYQVRYLVRRSDRLSCIYLHVTYECAIRFMEATSILLGTPHDNIQTPPFPVCIYGGSVSYDGSRPKSKDRTVKFKHGEDTKALHPQPGIRPRALLVRSVHSVLPQQVRRPTIPTETPAGNAFMSLPQLVGVVGTRGVRLFLMI